MKHFSEGDLDALLELARESGLIRGYEIRPDVVRISFEQGRTETVPREEARTYMEKLKERRWGV